MILEHAHLQHRYYLSSSSEKGVTVHRIPFSHPHQVHIIYRFIEILCNIITEIFIKIIILNVTNIL